MFLISPGITLILALFCAMFCATLCPTTAQAGIGFQAISPDELKMTSEPNAPGAPAIILYRQVDRDDSRNAHEDNYFRIKILNEEGRKYGDVEIPYFKGTGKVTNIKARTIRPDGTVVNFDGNVFDKTVVKARGVKYLAKTFALPEVQVGSIIEYQYTIDFVDYFIYDSHWILSNELFTKKAAFSLKPYHRDYPRNLGLRWNWQGIQTGPKEGPDRIVRMEAAGIPAFQTEDYMPPENELKARVDFIYSDDYLEKNPDAFWKKVGKRLNSNLEGFIDKRKAMEQAVAQIVSPNDTPEEKARKIYARVQQIRNTSYEVRRTEAEKKRDKEKEQSNVEDVWKRGYGDGQQITWLYLALVKAAGLEAYGVWASDRNNYFLNTKLMDSSKLDANVVLLKLNGQDVYCDPGSAFTPFGELPWAETNTQGLRLDKDGGSWVTTTLPESDVSRIERKADLKLNEETGGLEGKLVVTHTGLEARSPRVEERVEDETARKRFLEDEVKGFIPVAAEAELINSPDWTSSSTPLVAEFNIKVPGWSMSAGRRTMLAPGLFSSWEKHVFDHASRTYWIYYHYPSTKLDDITIDLPDGWQASSLPPEVKHELKVVGFAAKVEEKDGKLHIVRKVSNDVVLLDSKYYGALQDFYRMVRTSDEQQIVLLPGTPTASR